MPARQSVTVEGVLRDEAIRAREKVREITAELRRRRRTRTLPPGLPMAMTRATAAEALGISIGQMNALLRWGWVRQMETGRVYRVSRRWLELVQARLSLAEIREMTPRQITSFTFNHA